MSWLFGGGKPSESADRRLPESTHAQKQKHKQVEWLKEHVIGVVEVQRDELYRVTLTIQGKSLTLDIRLPLRFPLDGPVIKVNPPIRHAWVDEQMTVVGSPLIKNFSTHSNLGKAVKQVITELIDHPPLEFVSPSLSSSGQLPSLHQPLPYPIAPTTSVPYMYNSVPQPIPGSTSSPAVVSATAAAGSSPSVAAAERIVPSRPAPSPPGRVSGSGSSYALPPLPSLQQVTDMSNEELKKFLSGEDSELLIGNFIEKLDVIKKIQSDQETILQENTDQAGINLGHQTGLQDSWAKLQETYLELCGLRESNTKLTDQRVQMTQKYDQKKVVSQLKSLALDADTESEITAEDFLDDKITAVEFVKRYKQQRTLYHLRQVKYEKLMHTRS